MIEPTVRVLYHDGLFFLPQEDLGHDPSRLASTDGDKLAEYSARLCYRSLHKEGDGARPTPAYFANVLSKAHNCYDEQTEVLTSTGWKFWSSVTDDDALCTRTPDGCVEYQKPTTLVSSYYVGPMYRVDGQLLDLLVTPNHRMLVCPMTTRRGRSKRDFRLVTATDLGHKHHAYVTNGRWTGGVHVDPAVASLLGFAIGDGTVPRGHGHRQVSFNLRKPRKIKWLRDVAARAGWSITCHQQKLYLKFPDQYAELFHAIYDINRDKQIPSNVLTTWDADSLKALFDGLIESDGSVGRTHVVYYTVSRRLADQLQQLCLHVGLSATISATATESNFGVCLLHRVGIIRRCAPTVNKPTLLRRDRHNGSTAWVAWSGTVYCASVPNGVLYVRRHGKPVWCGNSVVAHAVETFELPSNVDVLGVLHCRPGLWVTRVGGDRVRFCLNLRAVTEWFSHGPEYDPDLADFADRASQNIYNAVHEQLEPLYPLSLLTSRPRTNLRESWRPGRVAPELPKEKWCSLLIQGVSRDLLQELVRHHWQANPSVESTRYVDKSSDDMLLHPALRTDAASAIAPVVRDNQFAARALYAKVFNALREQGVGEKSARGAARSVLPGAASTALVFSLSLFQARHLLSLREPASADPEIRELAARMRETLLTVWPDL